MCHVIPIVRDQQVVFALEPKLNLLKLVKTYVKNFIDILTHRVYTPRFRQGADIDYCQCSNCDLNDKGACVDINTGMEARPNGGKPGAKGEDCNYCLTCRSFLRAIFFLYELFLLYFVDVFS